MYIPKLRTQFRDADYISERFQEILEKSLKKDGINFLDIWHSWGRVWDCFAPSFWIETSKDKVFSFTVIVEQNDNCFLDFKKIEFKDWLQQLKDKNLSLRLFQGLGKFLNYTGETFHWKIKVEKIIIENGEIYFQNIRISLNNEKKKVVKTFKGKWKYMDNYYLHKGNECLYFSFSWDRINYIKLKSPKLFFELRKQWKIFSLFDYIEKYDETPTNIENLFELWKGKNHHKRKQYFKPNAFDSNIIRWKKKSYFHTVSKNVMHKPKVNLTQLLWLLRKQENDDFVINSIFNTDIYADGENIIVGTYTFIKHLWDNLERLCSYEKNNYLGLLPQCVFFNWEERNRFLKTDNNILLNKLWKYLVSETGE